MLSDKPKTALEQPLNTNERKLLRLIRTVGTTSRQKLISQMGVTAQAIGQIVCRLDEHQLLKHHKAIKIGLGQPPKPMSLNPDSAFSIGIKIGRRRTDILLVNLLGEVQEHLVISYAVPVASELLPQIEQHLIKQQARLAAAGRPLTGVGVAAPFALGGWHQLIGLSAAQADEWEQLNLVAAISAMTTRLVRLAKDTAAACIAELLNGHGQKHKNFLYIFVDTFIGGSVVQQGLAFESANGNAGAVASLPIGGGKQLLDVASLWQLEQQFSLAKLDPMAAYDERALDAEHWRLTQAWLSSASQALAASIVSGTAFLDMQAVVLDGAMSPALLEQLREQTQTAFNQFNWQGLWRPELLAGLVGPDAGALGGALMPLHEYFYA